MPEIEQLRAFVTAVECGSFSAAARKLGKAQSAVSATISNLEIDLDLSLFHRDGYRPVLTDAGESLLKHARSVLSSMDMLRGQAEALSGSIEPRFSFFVEDGLLVDRVRSLLTGTADKFPSLELRVEQLSRPSVLKAVQSGDADAAFVCEAPRRLKATDASASGFRGSCPCVTLTTRRLNWRPWGRKTCRNTVKQWNRVQSLQSLETAFSARTFGSQVPRSPERRL